MSRVPPALARSLDRLARRAHRFHRWAHHPLCRAYRGEVIALGRRARVCRGCALASAGAAAGAVATVVLPTPAPGTAVGALAASAVACAALSFTAGPRRPKLLTRALPAALAVFTAGAGLRSGGARGLAVAALAALLALLAVIAYRRRGPDRSPCLACPERDGDHVCSGYAPIARREAAFARVAGRLLHPRP